MRPGEVYAGVLIVEVATLRMWMEWRGSSPPLLAMTPGLWLEEEVWRVLKAAEEIAAGR
ncbi:MAG: hypothetical protein QXH44_05125 [Pyrobaculum sp.]